MSLRDEIHAKAECTAHIASKNIDAIVAIMSAGRTKPNAREIGNGTILEVLGIATGNALLDVLLSSDVESPYRHVKPLIEQGRLLIGSTLVQATLGAFVPDILSQAQADSLRSLGRDPNPYAAQEVSDALYNADGSEK